MRWPSTTRHVGCALTLAIFAITTRVAHADWPMARHDAARTGAADGSADITTPGAYWRTYLGGRIGISGVMPIDIESVSRLSYVSAGKLSLANIDGTPLWSSDNLSLLLLVGEGDLDGDGTPEIVARSADRVYVFDGATGEIRWAEEEGEIGTIGAVRIADADGDAVSDLLIEGCPCCQVTNGEAGFVYSFASGFSNPSRDWELPFAFCSGNNSLIIDDIDGDGDPDVLLGEWADFKLVDGASGAVIATSPSLGTWVGLSSCEAVDLDATPGKDLVCVHGTNLETAGAGHRVFALHYVASSGQLALLWSRDVGDVDETLTIAADFLHDLDGDGRRELAVSGEHTSGGQVTEILDASTGALLASLEGETVVGDAALTDRSFLITSLQDDVHAWTFKRGAATPLTLDWQIHDRRALVTRDWQLAARQPLSNRLVLDDVNGDGQLDLLTVNTKAAWVLFAHSLVSPIGATVGSYQAAPSSEILGAWRPSDGATTLSTSDGRLTTISTSLDLTGSFQTGGYYALGAWLALQSGPVTADLDGDGVAEILMPDSRGALLALDARAASNASPPLKTWERLDTNAPNVVAGLAGGLPGIACWQTDAQTSPPTEIVSVLDRTGEPVWSAPIGSVSFNDVLAGNLDGDGVPDLVVQWGLPGDTALRTTALAGTDGHALWTNVIQAGVTRIPAGAALVDWNNDGIDDVVFHHYGTRVLSGVDGSQIAFGGPTGAPYFMPIVVDLNGDGNPEVSLAGGFSPIETITSDLSGTVWTSNDDERPYPYAAVTTCPSGPVLVSGSLAHGSRMKVTLQTGTPGTWYGAVLAGGVLYPDEGSAIAAGASITNQLTSVHIHENLTGLGHPSAVVGSTDGWLYAVDPCTMTLDWAMPFGVPVGAVAFGDTDGDGLDEIIVSTADGYLHGIKQAALAAPAEVRDVDPLLGTDVDVDEIVTRGSLSASWDPIPGATGYQVSVALAEGGIISDPPWLPVQSTLVTFQSLSLQDGARYVIAVRAVNDNGVSPDQLSDGVLVHLDTTLAPDAGVDANGTGTSPGGCCRVGGTADGAGVLVLIVAFGLRKPPGRRRARAKTAPPRAA